MTRGRGDNGAARSGRPLPRGACSSREDVTATGLVSSAMAGKWQHLRQGGPADVSVRHGQADGHSTARGRECLQAAGVVLHTLLCRSARCAGGAWGNSADPSFRSGSRVLLRHGMAASWQHMPTRSVQSGRTADRSPGWPHSWHGQLRGPYVRRSGIKLPGWPLVRADHPARPQSIFPGCRRTTTFLPTRSTVSGWHHRDRGGLLTCAVFS